MVHERVHRSVFGVVLRSGGVVAGGAVDGVLLDPTHGHLLPLAVILHFFDELLELLDVLLGGYVVPDGEDEVAAAFHHSQHVPKHNRFNVSSRKSCDAGNNVVAFVRNWHFCTRKQNVLHQFSVVTLQSLKLSDAKVNI